MAYVDLNPIRAKMATSLNDCDHTSIKKRLKTRTEDELKGTLKAIAGKVKNRTMVLPLKDYIQLVKWTIFCSCKNSIHHIHVNNWSGDCLLRQSDTSFTTLGDL